MENKREETDMNQNEEIISENKETLADKLPDSQEGDAKELQAAELEKLQTELTEQKDKYLRLYSEFENFRRRTAKEKMEMVLSANEQLIKALIPVVDDFERAEKAFGDKKESKELEGFFLIQNKFRKILDQYGVKAMEIKAGADFNADLHEAITQIPAPEEKLKGKIVDVIEKGYLLNEKVIRFAKVVVGS
ncbi:MAG TPA: nucleotide exchange factor GrpE [Ohtaekwangia sp.]